MLDISSSPGRFGTTDAFFGHSATLSSIVEAASPQSFEACRASSGRLPGRIVQRRPTGLDPPEPLTVPLAAFSWLDPSAAQASTSAVAPEMPFKPLQPPMPLTTPVASPHVLDGSVSIDAGKPLAPCPASVRTLAAPLRAVPEQTHSLGAAHATGASKVRHAAQTPPVGSATLCNRDKQHWEWPTSSSSREVEQPRAPCSGAAPGVQAGGSVRRLPPPRPVLQRREEEGGPSQMTFFLSDSSSHVSSSTGGDEETASYCSPAAFASAPQTGRTPAVVEQPSFAPEAVSPRLLWRQPSCAQQGTPPTLWDEDRGLDTPRHAEAPRPLYADDASQDETRTAERQDEAWTAAAVESEPRYVKLAPLPRRRLRREKTSASIHKGVSQERGMMETGTYLRSAFADDDLATLAQKDAWNTFAIDAVADETARPLHKTWSAAAAAAKAELEDAEAEATTPEEAPPEVLAFEAIPVLQPPLELKPRGFRSHFMQQQHLRVQQGLHEAGLPKAEQQHGAEPETGESQDESQDGSDDDQASDYWKAFQSKSVRAGSGATLAFGSQADASSGMDLLELQLRPTTVQERLQRLKKAARSAPRAEVNRKPPVSGASAAPLRRHSAHGGCWVLGDALPGATPSPALAEADASEGSGRNIPSQVRRTSIDSLFSKDDAEVPLAPWDSQRATPVPHVPHSRRQSQRTRAYGAFAASPTE